LAASAIAWSEPPSNSATPPASATTSPGWASAAPRDEIRPNFARLATDGPDGQESLVIKHDHRDGLDGCWKKIWPIIGGKHYRFVARYQATGVAAPRRSVVAELHWGDAQGRKVPLDRACVTDYLRGATAMAETEFPTTKPPDARGWSEVSDTYQAPSRATQALVELHLRWAPGGEVRWAGVTLAEVEPPKRRTVRLATVHFVPHGGRAPIDNCRMYEPLIAEAARQQADLVVLGETLTYVGLGKSYEQVAEPIPGPSTEFFGRLAKKHNLYLVPGLLERDGNLVYNVAVLIGPDGTVVGKYRKVCLPRGEIDGGIAPGADYPVFATRFGTVGFATTVSSRKSLGNSATAAPKSSPGPYGAAIPCSPAPAPARITFTSSAAPTRQSSGTGWSPRFLIIRVAWLLKPRTGVASRCLKWI
jgi:hypothetical protein